MRNQLFSLCLLTGNLLLVSCTPIMENLPGVYKLDIQQGNIIDQETIDQLRPGMSKRQVLYVIGSPMLQDVFHQNRWDYIYSIKKGGEPTEQKRISLYFNGDNLSGISGDFRPSSKPPEIVSHETSIELPERKFDKTIWEKITGLFGIDTDERPERDIIVRSPNVEDSEDPLSSSSNPAQQ